jgi:nicotinate-nucleotide adenylyltransferase
MKKRALFGGSFDPLHNGHLAVVDTALETLCLDELIVVPAFVNPFKSGTHASAEQRLAWLQKTFADDPRVTVSDFEIAQQRPVRSIETVRHFLNEGETLYFIIGADNLASLTQWHAFEALNRLVTWAVATRGDIKIPDSCVTLDVDRPVSSTQLRASMQHHELPEKVAREIAAFYQKNQAEPLQT